MMTTGKLASYVRDGACAKWSPRAFEGSTPFMDGYIVWNGAPLTEAEVEAKRAEWEASVVADRTKGEAQAVLEAWDAKGFTRAWESTMAPIEAAGNVNEYDANVLAEKRAARAVVVEG